MFAKKDLSFLPLITSTPESCLLEKISTGREAMKRSGAQDGFIAMNMLQASALGCSIVLRAGEPPQHDKKRSPKSGLILSKTSNQGFFKGALAKEERFSRLDKQRMPKPHHPQDTRCLALEPTDLDYQFCMQLDINVLDILKELGPSGDLKVLNYDPLNHCLSFVYKEDRGPLQGFDGQFVIDLSKGMELAQFYSREWNHPQAHPDWDPELQIIKKPPELEQLPDDSYGTLFNQTFCLAYTETQGAISTQNPLKKAEVFASRLRSAAEFKEAMGKEHPYYERIKSCTTLGKVLNYLKHNVPHEACEIILDVYAKSSRIVAGDWDGLMLGHPLSLDAKYAEVINVFAPGSQGVENQQRLLNLTEEYFLLLREKAQLQADNQRPLSAFEKKILSMQSIYDVISDFALARAGCITAHELLFQQIFNDAYRDRMNTHYGEKQETEILQKAMDILLSQVGQRNLSVQHLKPFISRLIERELWAQDKKVHAGLFSRYVEHVLQHFILARQLKQTQYQLPHLQFDMNVQDLYQHGFDMRNPYGSNLDGAWLFISDVGSVFYGETQESLIELLLAGCFLEKSFFDLHPEVDLSKGWDKIITRQLELGQSVSLSLLDKYHSYLHSLKSSPCIFAKTSAQLTIKDTPRCIIKEESPACLLSVL